MSNELNPSLGRRLSRSQPREITFWGAGSSENQSNAEDEGENVGGFRVGGKTITFEDSKFKVRIIEGVAGYDINVTKRKNLEEDETLNDDGLPTHTPILLIFGTQSSRPEVFKFGTDADLFEFFKGPDTKYKGNAKSCFEQFYDYMEYNDKLQCFRIPLQLP
jgi:hypothetical protein